MTGILTRRHYGSDVCLRYVLSHRTLVPIQYPSHVVALGSLYVAALLSSFEQPVVSERSGYNSSQKIAAIFSRRGEWERKFQAQVEDLEGVYTFILIFGEWTHIVSSLVIAHAVIDLLIQSAQNHSANTSPRTPSSPTAHPSPRTSHLSSALPHAQPLVVPYKADQLIRLKIVMREFEHPPRPRQPLGNTDPSALYGGNDSSLLGRNEGTVRFLFGPPGRVGHDV